jgi:CTP synthase (UTP-ammonia lyase)
METQTSGGLKSLRFGLIGDLRPEVTAHRAIPRALQLVSEGWSKCQIEPTCLATDEPTRDLSAQFASLAGLWGVPGRPYRNTEGALRAIRFAREQGVPFPGTFGGFRHALLADARQLRGIGPS